MLDKVFDLMPEAFREEFANVHEINDATEFNVQKPAVPLAQKRLWSSYKNL